MFKLVTESPWSVAAQRLCAGVPAAWLLALVSRERVRLEGLRFSWPGGLAFGLHITVFVAATQRTSVANVQFIAALFPLLIVLVAPRMFGEQRQVRAVFGLVGALGGMAVMLYGGREHAARSALGDALGVLNLLAWTVYFVMSKWARQRGVSAVEYQVWTMTVAALVVTPLAVSQADDLWPISPHNLLWVLALAFGPGTFGHVLSNWAHRYVPAQAQSMSFLVVPVFASLIAWPVHSEPIGLLSALGMALVLGSVAASAFSWRAASTQATEAS